MAIIPPTQAEIDADNATEKEAEAVGLRNAKTAITSLIEILYENPDLLTSYATVGALKTAVKDRYKTKI